MNPHRSEDADAKNASNGVTTKLLFVVTKSNAGGAQRYVYDLAAHCPDAYEPLVAFGPAPEGSPGRLAKRLAERGVRTILVPELARDVSIIDIRAFRALLGLMRAERPGIVHLNSSKAGGLGALAARLARVPRIVFTVHGLPSDEPRPRLQRALIAIATWLTCILAHRVIAITAADHARLRRQPFLFGKVRLIHSGIETPGFETPADARKALRSIDPGIPDGPLVGIIAELHPNKDIPTAIEAVAETGAHLILLGDGEERARLETFANEQMPGRAHFLGHVPDAAKYLRAFDAFVLSSVKEGLPYVLLEAGAAHVPIIATNVGGVPDIVLDGFTGLLPAPRDPAALTAGLRRLLDDSSLARSLTDEMGMRIRASFSFEGMLRETFAQYA